MRVEIKIAPDIGEPIAIIHTPKMTPELAMWVEMLERAEDKPSLLIAKNDDKLYVIRHEDVEIIRTEGGETKLYNRNAQVFTIPKPLHEIQERLGAGFVRISRSAIVNIDRADHLSPSFNGTMKIAMKNGVSDYISRKYLGEFKKSLGM